VLELCGEDNDRFFFMVRTKRHVSLLVARYRKLHSRLTRSARKESDAPDRLRSRRPSSCDFRVGLTSRHPLPEVTDRPLMRA
jgi:hypothetical protein